MTIPSDVPIPRHGGDLVHAQSQYGTPQGGWLDLSTGINPVCYPAPPIDAAELAALPGRDDQDALIEAARAAYGLPTGVPLIATPGTEIALRLLPFVAPAGAVAIVGPTYESHRDAWATTKRHVVEISEIGDIPDNAAIVVLANPNNPDGRILAPTNLDDLAARLASRAGVLVVDEAFADLDPKVSIMPSLDAVPAVVLRSFGKFFGLAGLRLGFVGGSATIVDQLRTLLGDWPVSNAALTIGRAALADRHWQIATRLEIAGKAEHMQAIMHRHGLPIVGGTDLFTLVEHPTAFLIHTHLAKVGIWTRSFSDRLDRIRFGLPANETSFVRLDEGLQAAMRGLR